MQKECIIKAEGCFVIFTPRKSDVTVCNNPACRKEKNRAYAVEKGKREREIWKKIKPKVTKRLCIGVHCRGEREFKSIGGSRMCDKCKASIYGME